MKIVIDTNVLIDAWEDNFSYTRKIIDAVISGDLRAYASNKIWREYQLILDRLVNDPNHYELADRFFSAVEMVQVGHEVDVVKYDKEDNKFFSCAVAAEVDYIISNDMDLHEVGEYQGIKVMKPGEFWNRYQDENDPGGKQEWVNFMSGIMNN